MAALGGVQPWLMKYWRNKAHPPDTAGVEWLVPVEVGVKLLAGGEKQIGPYWQRRHRRRWHRRENTGPPCPKPPDSSPAARRR